MRSIIEDIQSEFRRFIDSRKETLLIVSCEPQDSALLLKGLEALDDDPESLDIFLTFGHPFNDPGQYVREIHPTISRELAGVNEELAERGEPATPAQRAKMVDLSKSSVLEVAVAAKRWLKAHSLPPVAATTKAVAPTANRLTKVTTVDMGKALRWSIRQLERKQERWRSNLVR